MKRLMVYSEGGKEEVGAGMNQVGVIKEKRDAGEEGQNQRVRRRKRGERKRRRLGRLARSALCHSWLV